MASIAKSYSTPFNKKIIFIIPFFFPNAGKSYALKHIQNMVAKTPNCSFASVSSDDIRGKAT